MTLVTGDRLAGDLAALGLDRGVTVLVHCSLSALGDVPGGAQTVVLALRRVLGPNGTIVVPSQSWQLCDPAYLKTELQRLWDEIRDSLPVYDPRWTPTRTMGLVAEAVRTHPDAVRSSHPHRSFAGWGPGAVQILTGHALDDPVGVGSPLFALYELGAIILLLGVGYEKCTALHLAESRSGLPETRVANGAPLLIDGQRRWVEFTEPVVDDSDFAAVGAAFEASVPGGVRLGSVGHAESRCLRMAALVDFAAPWMMVNRSRRQLGPSPRGEDRPRRS